MQIFVHNGKPFIAPAWASVALGGAAAVIGFDRFYGFSNAWMRLTQAHLAVEAISEKFALDWAQLKVAWASSGPTIEQVQAALAAVSAFLAQLQAAVQQETKEWVTEFQSALAELDKKITDQLPETPKLGALNVEVLNGDLCDDGWNVSLDGGDQERKYGKTAAFHGLVAGLHIVAAEGQIRKTSRRAEKTAPVIEGEAATVQLTLS